jgi:23S rRNA (adenine2030-N6)-methyltransferase
MNYRHAYHAGSFADVLKHAVLARVLAHLREKPAPFRVIDTHAGAGVYDLGGPEAAKTGEWRDGIARVREAQLPPAADALLRPYLDAVAKLNGDGALTRYPGSPALAQALMRRQDRLIACELEPNAAAALARHLRGDVRAKAIPLDGWTALTAYVPPKERRGVVLIDPPFEQEEDFARLAAGFEAAHRKWAGGIYLMWYPIKTRAGPEALARRLRRAGIAKILRLELHVGGPAADRLAACGLVVVNPPWTLESEMATILPVLAARLSAGGGGEHRIDRLGSEK